MPIQLYSVHAIFVHVCVQQEERVLSRGERPAGCSPVEHLCFSLERRERGCTGLQDRESSSVAKEFPTVAKK